MRWLRNIESLTTIIGVVHFYLTVFVGMSMSTPCSASSKALTVQMLCEYIPSHGVFALACAIRPYPLAVVAQDGR